MVSRKELSVCVVTLLCVLCFGIYSCGGSGGVEKDATKLPKVIIVTTGGTIAEKVDPETGAAVPAVSGQDLIDSVPGLGDIARIDVVQFSNIDSSQMSPWNWLELSRLVNKLLKDDDIAGIVITHGTDTMAEGAYFLDLTTHSPKPVVFTGAMRNASDLSPDGPVNIYNAVLQAASPDARNWGVSVTLNDRINAAREVHKVNSMNVQTFESGGYGYLGRIVGGKVSRMNERRDRRVFDLPEALPDVPLVCCYSGSDGRLIRHAVDTGARGLVVEGVGAGNVNKASFEALKYAIEKGVPVVITTTCFYGGAHPVYGGDGGGATLEKVGAILSADLDGAKARLLLMLALANDMKTRDQLAPLFLP